MNFTQFQEHLHHFILTLKGDAFAFVQTMQCKLTLRKKHLNSRYQILIGLKHGCFMKNAPKVEKPAVIANLHDKIREKWALPILRTRRKEMSEKLVEIKDLEISFGEGSKKFVAVKMLTSLSTRRNLLTCWRIW